MKTLFTALALFCAVNLSAADLKWAMKTQTGAVVLMTDVSFLLYSDGGTSFSVVCKDGKTIADVEKLTFEKVDPTGVESVVADNDVVAKIVDRCLTIVGCKAGLDARIVSVGGSVLTTVRTVADKTEIDVSALKSGAYVLKVGDTAVKFLKK